MSGFFGSQQVSIDPLAPNLQQLRDLSAANMTGYLQGGGLPGYTNPWQGLADPMQQLYSLPGSGSGGGYYSGSTPVSGSRLANAYQPQYMNQYSGAGAGTSGYTPPNNGGNIFNLSLPSGPYSAPLTMGQMDALSGFQQAFDPSQIVSNADMSNALFRQLNGNPVFDPRQSTLAQATAPYQQSSALDPMLASIFGGGGGQSNAQSYIPPALTPQPMQPGAYANPWPWQMGAGGGGGGGGAGGGGTGGGGGGGGGGGSGGTQPFDFNQWLQQIQPIKDQLAAFAQQFLATKNGGATQTAQSQAPAIQSTTTAPATITSANYTPPATQAATTAGQWTPQSGLDISSYSPRVQSLLSDPWGGLGLQGNAVLNQPGQPIPVQEQVSALERAIGQHNQPDPELLNAWMNIQQQLPPEMRSKSVMNQAMIYGMQNPQFMQNYLQMVPGAQASWDTIQNSGGYIPGQGWIGPNQSPGSYADLGQPADLSTYSLPGSATSASTPAPTPSTKTSISSAQQSTAAKASPTPAPSVSTMAQPSIASSAPTPYQPPTSTPTTQPTMDPKLVLQQLLSSMSGMKMMATGGELDPNAPTIVGEQGPELITPQQGGSQQVVPLSATGATQTAANTGGSLQPYTPPAGAVPSTAGPGGTAYTDALLPKVTEAFSKALQPQSFDMTDTFKTMRDIFNADLQSATANANEQASRFGLNPGAIDRNNSLVRTAGDVASRYNLGMLDRAQSAFESQQQRGLQALGMAPNVGSFTDLPFQRMMQAAPLQMQREQQALQNMLAIQEPAAQRSLAATSLMPQFYQIPYNTASQYYGLGAQAQNSAQAGIQNWLNMAMQGNGGALQQIVSMLSGTPLNNTAIQPSAASQLGQFVPLILSLLA